MRFRIRLLGVIGALAFATQCFAQQVEPIAFGRPRDCCPAKVIYPPSHPAQSCPESAPTPKALPPDTKADPVAAKVDPFAPVTDSPLAGAFGEQGLGGGTGSQSFNPAMFGDALGLKFIRNTRITRPGRFMRTPAPNMVSPPVSPPEPDPINVVGPPGTDPINVIDGVPRPILLASPVSVAASPAAAAQAWGNGDGGDGATFLATQAITSSAAIKVSDNENPRPQDRVYFSYHFFDGVRLRDTPVQDSYSVARQIIGFEKTFLEGNASLGLRIPFQQTQGELAGVRNSEFGDLTITTKYAFINDLTTGNVLSAGMLITLPTGEVVPEVVAAGIDRHVILQPWGGWIYTADRFYAMGFHSVLVPTDAQDVSFASNDVSLGFWLLRNRPDSFITAVAAQTEMHALTPLDHRNQLGNVYAFDQVTWTNGLNFLFGRNNHSLGAAVAVPISGPRVYDYEGIASLSIRF